MHNRLLKYIVTLFFTTVFLLPTVANLHTLSHLSENDELHSCEVCDVIASPNQADIFLDFASNVDITNNNLPSTFIPNTQYNIPLVVIASPAIIYNKPPPLV
ncbi:hypothetical protein ABN763_05025 [Spongiivirga sp. MCCC 1A20706]|uniref:hypothetical protein n=1 Tax=Spongiivirga sp. MCCC 1A20706 TaxID=3160963 RepID=UPI003977AC40